MGHVIISPQALDDVDAICAYLARDAPRMAEVFADRFFEEASRLAQLPKSGRVVPELRREDYREIIFRSYRVIYRLVSPELVEVIAVHHGARRLRDLTDGDAPP